MIKDKLKTQNDRNLKKFLSLDSGSLEYITLRSELKQHLTDPGILERSNFVGNDLREEARIILDAFEAITNGMHNPEVFSHVEAISEDSLLDLWKELIYAIKAFYEKNYIEMEKSLERIDPNSPLIMFKSILMQLSGKSQEQVSNKKQKAFIDNIIKDRSFIRSVISQIVESLEYDMEDLFLETSILIIHDLNRTYKETARKFAIWSMETASKYKYSSTELIAACKKLFGNTEAYRFTAIAMSKEEPDISLLFWMQSLISGLKTRDLKIHETGAYLTIISRLSREVKSSADNFYLESLNSLIMATRTELKKKFPGISESLTQTNSDVFSNPFEELIYLSSRYSSLEENRIRFKSIKDKAVTSIKIIKSKKNTNKPIQLSLF